MKRFPKMCVKLVGCVSLAGAVLAGAQLPHQLTDQDKQFLVTASQSDYTEITFSQLAVQKSQNPEVEAYATKMISDHKTLDKQMMPFANQMGVPPVTSLDAMHQQKFDQLSSLTGSEFNKQYMLDMDMDHHASLDAFKVEEQNTMNSKLKSTVKSGERVISQHTEMADQLSKKLGQPASGM